MEKDRVASGPIGSVLSEARLRQGMTIADVASRTKVSTRYLHAIEGDDLANLPSRVHALGFARAFAKCVRLDADEVADAIRIRLG